MLQIKKDNITKAKLESHKSAFPQTLPLQLQYPISFSNLRIIQKHLVYVIGLSEEMASNDVLSKYEYFGQYGTIQKIAVNKTKVYNKIGFSKPNYSAYITYALEEEASLAILVIDNFQCGEYLLRASYGTTKYCSFFLKGSQCPNKECLYYHIISNEEDIINKEDMNSTSNVFYQQQKTAMRICNIYSNEARMKLKLLSSMNTKTIFPVPYSIYQKEIVIKNDLLLKTHFKNKIKNINESNCSQAKSTHCSNTKPIEALALENSTLLSSSEESISTPKSTSTPTVLYFQSKSFKVKSNKEKISLSSSISFEKLKIPNLKRLTFSCINHCNNSVLFQKRKHSRFDFTSKSQKSPTLKAKIENNKQFEKEDEEEEEVEEEAEAEEEEKDDTSETVPNYVSDLIGMTLSRFSFFKQFNHFNNNETEELLCNTFCYHQKDTWSQFILDNINSNKVISH